ncbi:hypothetical protein C7B65_06360 [Phormidesmis priestleyi ULC007]|uniref:Nuclear transport factor 2 family protein n=1 Tax=Phormidesmis priestleyi ULC007 TaxID=1920490 RepID=A0A2T1DJP2_9CYAN|nr:hypothetical protein C7B65_06360 [Phormidesmis priestleyi ULC007]PZO54350.1 MAG: hypothetical protein DCF14_02005 [Phormidesmis priestleyi]
MPQNFRQKPLRSLFLLTLGLTILGSSSLHDRAIAATPETAPVPLKQALTQIDAAANSKNLPGVLQFYSPNFAHSDGLNRRSLEQALTQLWKQYPNLTYRTELKSWQPDGRGIRAETVTYISGTQMVNGQSLKLDSTLQSRQRFEGQTIVQQDVLAETSKVTSGENPPDVKVSLPQQVRVGQDFSFDAIVQDPLGSDLLLGSALEESIKPSGYLNPTTTDLELLTSGGIFKVGRASKTPENRWISAVLVRHGGTTMVTQRLRIVAGSPIVK